MKLKDIARKLPAEIWNVFKPILPPVVWIGNGRKPCSNKRCLHGILYVLVTGIPWEMMPVGFPSYKTCQRRLQVWVNLELFKAAWQQLAEEYDLRRGINWDQICVDGSKHPAKKGAKKQAQIP